MKRENLFDLLLRDSVMDGKEKHFFIFLFELDR